MANVLVLSRDLMFYTAAEGVIGATGNTPRQAESLEDAGEFDLLVADFVSFPLAIESLTALAEPHRIAIFTPHERVNVFRDARAAGIVEVHRRGALARELPRILEQLAPIVAP